MKEDFYISLLYKKLNHSLVHGEEKVLSEWLAASEDNRILAQQVELAWKESASLAASPSVDLDAAFAELETKIAEDEQISSTSASSAKTFNFRRNWVKIAAAVTFLLAAFLLGKDYLSPQAPSYTEIQTETEIKSIELPDKSIVQLNKHSKLRFPKVFKKGERSVSLEGEGFFEVSHNPQRPFIVETASETVKVLGTSFRVRAYDHESHAEVQVATGKVSFRSKTGSDELILTKNQKGILDKSLDKLELLQSSDLNEMAWGTQTLYFNNVPLQQVFRDLEKYYGVSFQVASTQIYDCNFTATFEKEPIDTVLSTIHATLNVAFNKKSTHTYQVEGDSCE